MKIESGKSDSIVEQKSFNIIANDKMFSILSSKIYTDKIMAVIRELSTNAYDAHVLANNEKPFDVKLPDYSNGQFYIRDYGNGLNEQQICDLYTTYGYSDKSDSNEYIGCLGLGSKSPFAFTDSFVVTSYQDNYKKVYTCFMDNGVPKICKFDQGEVIQQNGLKISFQVDKSHVALFQKKAEQFYSWFLMKPKMVGMPIMCIDNLSRFRNGISWFVGTKRISVWMGGVKYNVDFDNLCDYVTRKKLDEKCLLQQINDIVIKGQIGQFDISVSRQSIQITQQNVKKIIDKIEKFFELQKQYYQKQLQKFPDLLTKIQFLRGQFISRNYLKQIFNSYKEQFFYKNTDKFYESKYVKYYYNFGHSSCKVNYIEKIVEQFDLRPSFCYGSAFNFYVIFDEKMKNKSCYKNYLKYKNKNAIITVTNDIKFFEWCKRVGMTVTDGKQFELYKQKKKQRESCFYTIRSQKDNSVCDVCYADKQKILQQQKIYYVPLTKNQIVLQEKERTKFISNWIFCLENSFKIKVIGLRKKQYQEYKDDSRFIDARKFYLQNIEFTESQIQKVACFQEFQINCNLSKMVRSGCIFDKQYMNDSVKKKYQLLLMRLKNDNIEQRNKYLKTLNQRELFCYYYIRYKCNRVQRDYFKQLYEYIYQNYPIIGMFIRKSTYIYDDEFVTIKDYIRMIQKNFYEKKEKKQELCLSVPLLD